MSKKPFPFRACLAGFNMVITSFGAGFMLGLELGYDPNTSFMFSLISMMFVSSIFHAICAALAAADGK